METKPRNAGSLVIGAMLVIFGLLALASQLFKGLDFWGDFWPFFVIAVGVMFFAGMFAGGKSTSGLAIPGTIIAGIGLILLVQNLTNYYESWAYAWALIIIFVGLGVYIMGWVGGSSSQRKSGGGLMRLGLILFLIFGAFFEMLFRSSTWADYFFPVGLILLGLYLVLRRSGLFTRKEPQDSTLDQPKDPSA
jgi:hypothetical protein